jgi:hypothetical protein
MQKLSGMSVRAIGGNGLRTGGYPDEDRTEGPYAQFIAGDTPGHCMGIISVKTSNELSPGSP